MFDLQTLARAIGAEPLPGLADTPVRAIEYDSRRVGAGSVFFAIPGFHVDGHAFIAEVAARGALAAVVRRDRLGEAGVERLPLIAVADTRVALSAASAAFHGSPGRSMRVIGVTGTDGKTTTTYLISAVLEAAENLTGLMGTVEYKVGSEWRRNASRQTTAEAPEVQALLAEMRGAGVSHAVIEASSHGLELRKLDHCEFAIAVVTNVGEDHLELHGTAEAYLAAKGRLFELLDARSGKGGRAAGVVNADDARSADYLRTRTSAPVIAYGIEAPAEVRAERLELRADGSSFDLVLPDGRERLTIRLPGRFNVSNALAAAAVAWLEGIAAGTIARALSDAPGVPGRMERVERGQPFTVVVDYAHTGPAFEKVLSSLRPLTAGRLIAVFGCAGGRSPERRAGMGGVAARLADFSVLTDEDPHEEEPEAILREIADAMQAAGAVEGAHFAAVRGRREAIRDAFARAGPGDVVLLAGKGHEQSIIIGREKTPWDERRVAEEELAALGWR